MKINFGTSKVSFSHFFKGFNSHFLVIENYASQKYALQGFNTQAATLPIQFFLAAFVGSLDFSTDFILLSLPHLKQCVPYVFYGECMETNPPAPQTWCCRLNRRLPQSFCFKGLFSPSGSQDHRLNSHLGAFTKCSDYLV